MIQFMPANHSITNVLSPKWRHIFHGKKIDECLIEIVLWFEKPSERDLHAIPFHFAIRIRLGNFEREVCKIIKELYACSTKEAKELIPMCIHMHGTIFISSRT